MIYLIKVRQQLAFLLLLIFCLQFVQLPISYALTGGPSQPETKGFQQAGTSDMVNLFTGDFSYNIPLFELPGPNGGYPFNLGYQSGIGMDQEASWVGLGWSLTPGAINRQMRGLPDEFNKDMISTKMDMQSSVTVGIGAGASVELVGNDAITATVGLGVRYNNYSGFGYSIDSSIGYQSASSDGDAVGVGLNVSLDSKEGVSLSPRLGLGPISVNANYNSRQGLTSYTYDLGLAKTSGSYIYEDKDKNKKIRNVGSSLGGTNISLASPAYTPSVSVPMWNENLSGEFKVGGSFWAVFGTAYVRGFFNRQKLKNKGEWVDTDTYGYLNYQNSESKDDVLDFNREKDGLVTNNSSNLAIPSLTYDIYSVAGQGIAAMYRPLRNDIGIIRDPFKKSETAGGSVGVDVGPAASHVGTNLSVNYAESYSGKWMEQNDANDKLNFKKEAVDDISKPWYFKVHGEPTAESTKALEELGGEKAVRLELIGNGKNAKASAELTDNRNWSRTLDQNQGQSTERKQRAQVVESYTNKEILSDGLELVNAYKNNYYTSSGSYVKFERGDLPTHHLAGFTATSADGLRYNYTIPAYNKTQEEHLFSARPPAAGEKLVSLGSANNTSENAEYEYSGTDKYLKVTKTPDYAHSYLLTSILGTDYVDVTGDGVTEDDLGYWVKFTYKKSVNNYKWRDPFYGGHYQRGWETDPRDDKGSFTYGEKEIWYLERAETKSHVAVFETNTARNDAKGVSNRIQKSTSSLGASKYQLDAIKLYTRLNQAASPIKTVKFEYDYELCPGVENNSENSGKLTLKKLWFEYGGVTRPTGYISPYEFAYDASNNPGYDRNAYDRWGNYKPHEAGDPLSNNDFPYVEQDPSRKEEIDQWASAWSLKSIKLPSGAQIMVDYETDDYSHVQHLEAMQMVDIVDPGATSGTLNTSIDFNLTPSNAAVRFKLERPISGSLTATEQENEVKKYLDSRTKQLFFKYKMSLRKPEENKFEFIQGYVDIDFNQPMVLEKDGSGDYAYGRFHVLKEDGFNPFILRAWQHLRTNQPELANMDKIMEDTDNVNDQISHMKSMGSVFTQIKQMFTGFYNYCNIKGWGETVKANKAWIRLKSPDLIKYGGGLRVKQITMKDNWQHDEEGIYGQVYEYTDEGEKGELISSGVAAYEPLAGGEENPHRFAKKWVESVPLRADNITYFEYPINESYYPGPQVGYRKVKVYSLASAYRAGKEVLNVSLSDGSSLFPEDPNLDFGSTGATMHEYYTAKEFPIIADETEKQNKPHNLRIPIPLLGSVSVERLTASQGYSLVTNNMHGQVKQISNYGQERSGSINFDEKPISYVKYNYAFDYRNYQGKKVKVLNNTFVSTPQNDLRLATEDELTNDQLTKFHLSQENEFFVDMRQHIDKSWLGGVDINLDIAWLIVVFIPAPIPIPSAWPEVSSSEKMLRTAVTNKIIYKSGIQLSTEAYDGGSLIRTENMAWDKLTGAVSLTKVNNNYDDPVYTYNYLAYKEYEGMGAAYNNIGLKYSVINLQDFNAEEKLFRFTPNSNMKQYLYPGDEVILNEMDETKSETFKAIYVGKRDGEHLLFSRAIPKGTDYVAQIVRSGNRNQLSVSMGSVTALVDPTTTATNVNYSKTIQVPE